MKKRNKFLVVVALVVLTVFALVGCEWAGFGSSLNELSGNIKGNTYECQFYSNSGEQFMTAEGENIKISANLVDEYTYNGENWERTETMSLI